jgi:hypothetical protein
MSLKTKGKFSTERDRSQDVVENKRFRPRKPSKARMGMKKKVLGAGCWGLERQVLGVRCQGLGTSKDLRTKRASSTDSAVAN